MLQSFFINERCGVLMTIVGPDPQLHNPISTKEYHAHIPYTKLSSSSCTRRFGTRILTDLFLDEVSQES